MKRSLALLTALFTFFAISPVALAQVGIGAQVGDPTGINLKFGIGPGSIDLAAGWNLDNHVTAQGHYLIGDNRLPVREADLRFFYGPGAYIRVTDGNNNADGDTRAGVSFNVGVGLYATRNLEIFGQITPRLQLVNSTDFDIGGALGLRFYLN